MHCLTGLILGSITFEMTQMSSNAEIAKISTGKISNFMHTDLFFYGLRVFFFHLTVFLPKK